MDNKPYQSVSCSMHSELELTIMHGETLKIRYIVTQQDRAETNERIIEIKPQDIITRRQNEKGEFLVGQDKSGQVIEIRLDKICHFKIINSRNGC